MSAYQSTLTKHQDYLVNSQYSDCKQECQIDSINLSQQQLLSLQNRINKINGNLASICSLKLDSLNSLGYHEKLNTIDIIEFLLGENIKHQQNSSKLGHYRRKTEQYLLERQEALQKITRDQRSISVEKQTLIIKKQQLQRQFKQNIEKLYTEKQQFHKQYKKIFAREKAYQAQFRKKDNQIKSMQDSIKKFQQKNQSKSHLYAFTVHDTLSDVTVKKQINSNVNSTLSEYQILGFSKIQQTLKQISQENLVLKQHFLKFVIELNAVYEICNERLEGFRNFITDELLNISIVRPQLFNLPLIYSESHINQTYKNLSRLKQIIDLKLKQKSNSQSDTLRMPAQNQHSSNQSSQSTKKLKDLIQNYKQITKSQDQILNRILSSKSHFHQQSNLQLQSPSKNNQNPELSNLIQLETEPDQQNCWQIIDNDQLDKIKVMISGQIDRIESKNKLLEQSKDKIQKDLMKTQNIKFQLMKKHKQIYQFDQMLLI